MSEAKSLNLEARVAALEAEMAKLRKGTGWAKMKGRFANDPIYDEAMRLGRQYRESLRPKTRKKPKTRNARP